MKLSKNGGTATKYRQWHWNPSKPSYSLWQLTFTTFQISRAVCWQFCVWAWCYNRVPGPEVDLNRESKESTEIPVKCFWSRVCWLEMVFPLPRNTTVMSELCMIAKIITRSWETSPSFEFIFAIWDCNSILEEINLRWSVHEVIFLFFWEWCLFCCWSGSLEQHCLQRLPKSDHVVLQERWNKLAFHRSWAGMWGEMAWMLHFFNCYVFARL